MEKEITAKINEIMARPMKLDFIPEYKENLKEMANFVLKKIEDSAMQIKYSRHNPLPNCECDDCLLFEGIKRIIN